MTISLGTLVWPAILLLLLWLLADVKSMLRRDRERAALSLEGRWEDLNRHFERSLGTWRPFARLFRALFMPGILEAQYATHLYIQGRLDQALALADRAAAKSARHAKILAASLASRTQILAGLGRYDEARSTIERANSLEGVPPLAASVGGLVELCCGRFDEALARAQATLQDPRTADSARLVASAVHRVRGEFREAVAVLLYSPADIAVFYTPDHYRKVVRVPEGARLMDLLREERQGVVQPIRYMAAAEAYVDDQDWNGAIYALGRAEESLGLHPTLRRVFAELRALTCAGEKDTAGVERNLGAARDLVRQVGSRSWTFENHLRAGRAYLTIDEVGKAMAELTEAEKGSLHPMEKHGSRYWLGRAHEAAGRKDDAARFYRGVTADRFGTWMARDAEARLAAAPPA